MKNHRLAIFAVLTIAVLVGTFAIHAQNAQPAAAIKRSILLKQDTTIPGREALMVSVELPAGVAEGRHTHPADLYVFVREGSIVLETDGKNEKTYSAGDAFYVAPGQIHQAINKTNAPAKLDAVFIAEKGKPLTTPVK